MKAGPWQSSDTGTAIVRSRLWDNGALASQVLYWTGDLGGLDQGFAYDPQGKVLADTNDPQRKGDAQAWLDRAIEQWEAEQ